MLFNKVFANSVFIYMSTRYLTYFLMFITSMISAVKMGPYYFGIWGLIMLVLQYFQCFDFGIPNSANVLLVHQKNNKHKQNIYIVNSIILITILSLSSFLLVLISNAGRFSLFSKYNIGDFLLWIGVIAALQYFYNYIIVLLRVKGRIIITSIVMSVIGVLNFISVFIFTGEQLLHILMIGYIIGYLTSIIIICVLKEIPPLNTWEVNFNYQKEILNKGFFLFLYNLFANSIFFTVRFFVSTNYSVEDFGLFTFSYTIVTSILLLLNSFSFIIYPKVVDSFSGVDYSKVLRSISYYRDCYLSSSHLLIYFSICLYPLFLYFFPSYKDAILSIRITSLTILLGLHTVGFVEFLTAQNKEKLLSIVAFFVFAANVIFLLITIIVFRTEYSWVPVATMVLYFIYSILLSYCVLRTCGCYSLRQTISIAFPHNYLIPFLCAFVVCSVGINVLVLLPLFVFVLLNRNSVKALYNIIVKIANDPTKIIVK